ncbi:MAG: helix-turn-helix domain-containing protein [Chlamydiia bacterium]|nr:helix-turn-helix domain-containing protein [Chlamydiia bacterium]
MKEFGEAFRQKRHERNLSLKEVENATSIRMSYLQAIEEGDVSRLISPVYAQGFVKQYAIFLGLDADAIIRQHPEVFNRAENQHFDYGIGTLEKRGAQGSGVNSLPNLVWVAVFVGVLVVAWGLAHYLEIV